MINLAVFISGNGSNLQSIINAIDNGKLKVDLRIVLSDKKEAYGLERAKKAGIKNIFIDPENCFSREVYERDLLEILKDMDINLIVLAGFMRILSPYFINNFTGEIMNIHPSLLPCFPGLNAQRQALEYGVKYTGCTVHFLDEGMDTGPIIIQAAVEVFDNDDEQSLANRIREKEHEIYPEAISLFAEGRLSIEGRSVKRKTKGEDLII
jgi:phosphoribosylglycinamide formyltransferase 1